MLIKTITKCSLANESECERESERARELVSKKWAHKKYSSSEFPWFLHNWYASCALPICISIWIVVGTVLFPLPSRHSIIFILGNIQRTWLFKQQFSHIFPLDSATAEYSHTFVQLLYTFADFQLPTQCIEEMKSSRNLAWDLAFLSQHKIYIIINKIEEKEEVGWTQKKAEDRKRICNE